MLVVVIALLGVKGVEASDARWIADKEARVSSLARDLAGLAGPGASVQVMDVTEGGIHALLRLHVRQPTRFLYDFHFFHDERDPRRNLASERPGQDRAEDRRTESASNGAEEGQRTNRSSPVRPIGRSARPW